MASERERPAAARARLVAAAGAARAGSVKAGRAARLRAAGAAAKWLRGQDPQVLGHLAEVGLIEREWLERRTGPVVNEEVAPGEVITRALEALVERRPSTLANLGLSTVTVLRGALEAPAAGARTVAATIVFTDLEGFTAWTSEAGDEAAREVLQAHYLQAGRVVRSRGGTVVKRLGDGLLLRFPQPLAAVLATLELVGNPAAPLRMRAGAHAGDVLDDGTDVAGSVVNTAAKIADLADGGEFLATPEVAAAAADHPAVRLGAEREATLPGVPGTVCVLPVSAT